MKTLILAMLSTCFALSSFAEGTATESQKRKIYLKNKVKLENSLDDVEYSIDSKEEEIAKETIRVTIIDALKNDTAMVSVLEMDDKYIHDIQLGTQLITTVALGAYLLNNISPLKGSGKLARFANNILGFTISFAGVGAANIAVYLSFDVILEAYLKYEREFFWKYQGESIEDLEIIRKNTISVLKKLKAEKEELQRESQSLEIKLENLKV